MLICRKCGAIVEAEDNYCRVCGTKVDKHIYCPNCGSQCVPSENGVKCPNCDYSETMEEAMDEFIESLKNLDENTLNEINDLLDQNKEK